MSNLVWLSFRPFKFKDDDSDELDEEFEKLRNSNIKSRRLKVMEEIQLAEGALQDSKVALKKAQEQVGFWHFIHIQLTKLSVRSSNFKWFVVVPIGKELEFGWINLRMIIISFICRTDILTPFDEVRRS